MVMRPSPNRRATVSKNLGRRMGADLSLVVPLAICHDEDVRWVLTRATIGPAQPMSALNQTLASSAGSRGPCRRRGRSDDEHAQRKSPAASPPQSGCGLVRALVSSSPGIIAPQEFSLMQSATVLRLYS